MPIELVKECIGKKCTVSLMTGDADFTGVVKEIEGYWVKLQEDDSVRIINGVAVRDIKILP